jgi:hypothetical protein
LCVDILKVTQTIEPEKDARLRHHPSILRDPDETRENPDAPDNGDKSPAEGVVNELESRLFKGRKVMVFGHLPAPAISALLPAKPFWWSEPIHRPEPTMNAFRPRPAISATWPGCARYRDPRKTPTRRQQGKTNLHRDSAANL